MNAVLLILCLITLYLCPVLYPSLSSFTAYFFCSNDNKPIANTLLISSAICSALICATIIPRSDTLSYIESYKDSIRNSNLFETWTSGGFEPLYKVYEYLVGCIVGDKEKAFLLVTSLIIHLLFTLGTIRLCNRLNNFKVACIILACQHSLVAPSMGVPLFLLRSSLSLSLMLFAISFYKQKTSVFYLLSIAAVFTHYTTIFIFLPIIIQDILKIFGRSIKPFVSKKHYKWLKMKIWRKTGVPLFVLCSMILIFNILVPQITISFLGDFISLFGTSDAIGAEKSTYFVQQKNVSTFLDLSNPVFITNIIICSLCFLDFSETSISKFVDTGKVNTSSCLLDALRLIGRSQMILIFSTLPFTIMPYRLGLFNFLFFPIWLINIPFLILPLFPKILFKRLIIISLVSIVSFAGYRLPKTQDRGDTGGVVVLDSKPFEYKFTDLISFFL